MNITQTKTPRTLGATRPTARQVAQPELRRIQMGGIDWGMCTAEEVRDLEWLYGEVAAGRMTAPTRHSMHHTVDRTTLLPTKEWWPDFQTSREDRF